MLWRWSSYVVVLNHERPILKGEELVFVASSGVGGIVALDVSLKDSAVLLGDSVDEVSAGAVNVHIPSAGAVPVETVDGFVELGLCGCGGGLQVAAHAERRQTPVPLAAGGEGEGEMAVGEALGGVDAHVLGLGIGQDVGEEGVAAGFGAEGALHLKGEAELLGGVGFVIDGEAVAIDSLGLGDDGIDQRAEAEGLRGVGTSGDGVEQLFEPG